MAKASKPKPSATRSTKYEKPVVVKGSFMDVIGAAIKQADKKMGKKAN